MSVTLDLPKDLENKLSAKANQIGLSLPEYVLRILSTGLEIAKTPKTGADLVDYWHNEGLIGTRTDITDSQEYARQIREQAERRIRS